MLPFSIVTFLFVSPVNPVPDHPVNVYPVFVGLFKVILSVSTV